MHYLISSKLTHGIATAEIDFKWKRTGNNEFINNDDEPVKIINENIHELRGGSEFKVYLGYDFSLRNDANEILDIIKKRNAQIITFHEEKERCSK